MKINLKANFRVKDKVDVTFMFKIKVMVMADKINVTT